jgi:hypothetical protein
MSQNEGTATAENQQASAAETAREQRKHALQTEFPVGQLVECIGGDYPNNQGKVTGVVEKGLVFYVVVTLEVYTDGRRRPDTRQPEFAMRGASLRKIEAYRDVPAPKPAAAPTAPAPTEAAAPAAEESSAAQAEEQAEEAAEEREEEAAEESADGGW